MTVSRLLVHISLQPIRWGDMDALGHVNNTVYFRYMEQARAEWLDAQARMAPRDASRGCVIAHASCDYVAPLVYPGTVEVRMFLGDPGRTSLGSFYELWMAGRRYAEGTARIVWIDLSTGRPTRLPDHVAEALRHGGYPMPTSGLSSSAL